MAGHRNPANPLWGEGPRSNGPTGAAIRIGEIQVNQDFARSSVTAPWRDEALKRNYHASIGLPLRVDGQVFGALTIYAEQPYAFDADEVSLSAWPLCVREMRRHRERHSSRHTKSEMRIVARVPAMPVALESCDRSSRAR
ncbi:MAG: GAF domain-containing protein [Rhodospirillaceae bacterium]